MPEPLPYSKPLLLLRVQVCQMVIRDRFPVWLNVSWFKTCEQTMEALIIYGIDQVVAHL